MNNNEINNTTSTNVEPTTNNNSVSPNLTEEKFTTVDAVPEAAPAPTGVEQPTVIEAIPEATPIPTELPTVDPLSVNSGDVTPRTAILGESGATSANPATTNVNINTNTNDKEDNGAVVNENLKKVEIDYKPPSKAKSVALIMFFIFLIAFIIFLPNITTLVNELLSGQPKDVNEKIVNGKLNCSISSNTTNLDKDYNLVFVFNDNKLETLDYRITTKGDATLDEKTLDSLASQCNMLKEYTSKMSGISVSCDYSDGKLIEKQVFNYGSLDEKDFDSAYTEAGGTLPQYTNGQDMDSIEKNMNASGYTCEREKKN